MCVHLSYSIKTGGESTLVVKAVVQMLPFCVFRLKVVFASCFLVVNSPALNQGALRPSIKNNFAGKNKYSAQSTELLSTIGRWNAYFVGNVQGIRNNLSDHYYCYGNQSTIFQFSHETI